MTVVEKPKVEMGAYDGLYNYDTQEIWVLDSLPKSTKEYVIAHETQHYKDRDKDMSVLWREVRACFVGFLKSPFGSLRELCSTLFSKERRDLYKDRIGKGY